MSSSAFALIGDTFQARIGIWKCWFLRRGETGVPGKKPLGVEKRTNNKLNPHMTPGPGIETSGPTLGRTIDHGV